VTRVKLTTKEQGTLGSRLSKRPAKHLYLYAQRLRLAPFMENNSKTLYLRRIRQVIIGSKRSLSIRKNLHIKMWLNMNYLKMNFLSEEVRNKLVYLPTVTREEFPLSSLNEQKMIVVDPCSYTDLINIGSVTKDLGMPEIIFEDDRFMICGTITSYVARTLWVFLRYREVLLERNFSELGDTWENWRHCEKSGLPLSKRWEFSMRW